MATSCGEGENEVARVLSFMLGPGTCGFCSEKTRVSQDRGAHGDCYKHSTYQSTIQAFFHHAKTGHTASLNLEESPVNKVRAMAFSRQLLWTKMASRPYLANLETYWCVL